MDQSIQTLRSRVEVLKKEIQSDYENLRSEIRNRHFFLILYISCVVFLLLTHSKPVTTWEYVVLWLSIGLNSILVVKLIYDYRRNRKEDRLHKFVIAYSSAAISDHMIAEMEIEELAMEAANEDTNRPNPGNRLN